jgi:hypothetical protein
LELATQKEKISTDGGMMKAAADDSSIVWGKTRKQETVENVAGPTNTSDYTTMLLGFFGSCCI